MADVCCICRCMTMWIMTLAICFFNTAFCMSLSIIVLKTSVAGYAFIVIFFLWNLLLLLSSICPHDDLEAMKDSCWRSCLGVMVLLAVSFTLITRYHYYERWPKYPEERDGKSTLLVHKMGLILLVSGIPVIYGCNIQHLRNDKKMIYRVVADFIDIYEMAELLALGAPSCTPVHSSNAYNITMKKDLYNNTRFAEQQFNCIESTYSALKEEGSIETAVQVFCSFSFLLIFVIYIEALDESRNSKESLRKYVKYTLLIQDIPFLVIRIWVWILYGFKIDQFIFLVKNALSTSLISLEFCKCCFSSVEADKENQSPNSEQPRNAREQRSQTNPGFDGNA